MTTVFDEILQWANELPYWEQVALDKLLEGRVLDDADYDELLESLLEDENLAERKSDRTPLHIRERNSLTQDGKVTILLKEISELENVNALVPNQRLTFSERLTAIYGLNGSGKSGYARVLGSAGFTRGDREILPDITKPCDGTLPIKAKVKVNIGGSEKIIPLVIGSPCAELSSFYVFDSTSVHVHVKGKNTFSFSPAGLSILTKLSKATDEVRNRLATKIQELENPSDFQQYFSGESSIKDMMQNLGSETDITELTSLAKLTTEDEKRLHELEVQIGTIGLGRQEDEIAKKKEDLDALRRQHSWFLEAQKRLAPQSVEQVNRLMGRYQELDHQAKKLSLEQFRHEPFTQVGTEAWTNFIKTAHALAIAEGQATRAYPQEGDDCLLCHQPLSPQAQQLILQLWSYLTGDIQSEIQKIQDELNDKYRLIESEGEFSFLDDLSIPIGILSRINPVLAGRARNQLDKYVDWGEQLLSAISSIEPIRIEEERPEDTCSELLVLIQRFEQDISSWEQLKQTEELEKLESERLTLAHRKQLNQLLPQVQAYVNQRIWANKASKVGGSTHHITKKYNGLFDDLVKNRYIEIFEKTLISMGRPLHVQITTSGKKGETVKQIQLKSHVTAEGIADPEKVLSEGEKRAIALADFLTEAALDISSNGIILDDPVTSLDLEWRRTIAQLLAMEAEKRQVVVFTHDMAFLYLLLTNIEKLGIEKHVHWIQRGPVDDLPGYVRLDNCPALEQDYKSSQRAREIYTLAIHGEAKQQDTLIRDGMAALRTSYEALVVFELFGGVVQRFEERISIGALASLVWDDQILEEIIESYARLSRYIEGHLHSDSFAEPLKLDMLDCEIVKYDALKKRIKDLQKSKKKKQPSASSPETA